jgi:hypothetical protein
LGNQASLCLQFPVAPCGEVDGVLAVLLNECDLVSQAIAFNPRGVECTVQCISSDQRIIRLLAQSGCLGSRAFEGLAIGSRALGVDLTLLLDQCTSCFTPCLSRKKFGVPKLCP